MGQSGSGSGSSGAGGSGGAGGTGRRPEQSRTPGGANRPAGSGGAKGAGGQARKPASQSQGRTSGTRPPGGGGSRPPVRREAATAAPTTGFKATIDRTLPPFSLQRYVAIWVLMMIPLALVLFLLLRPAGNSGGATGGTANSGGSAANVAGAGNCQAPNEPGKYFVLDTAKGCIVARLYTDASAKVPNTIANFEQKANSGFFNGLVFHRVEDWVIQGGDPQGTGGGGGKMPSEYNDLTFKAGSLGIARGQDPTQNNDSQFFFTKTPAEWLNGQYTNWGEVVQGMEAVNQMAIGDKINAAAVVERK
ncbi:MAG: peptidylprolyl isomerase [Chloroflexota bacterium]|nr:peptidylprolyl isomerase [Chloroflexota bacterium]